MSARWLVERRPDDFEDVGADAWRIHESGALEFYNGSILAPRMVIIYAPGQWITLVPEDGDVAGSAGDAGEGK